MRFQTIVKFAAINTFYMALMLSLIIGFSSCHKAMWANKQMDKVKSICDASSDTALKKVPAAKCAIWYKPIVGTKTITKYLPGKPYAVPGETKWRDYNCDSATKAQAAAGNKSGIVRVPYPVYRQVDTSAITNEIDRENVAALAAKDITIAGKDKQISALQAALAVSKASADTEKGKVKAEAEAKGKWRGRALWTWILLALTLGGWSYFKLKGSSIKAGEKAVKDLIS